FNHPFVKVFEEEREMTVMLLVDISASGDFGTSKQFKRELITELCAVLSFSAIQNNDKIGIIFFTDKIEKFIPPKKGKSHILRIIRELIDFKPTSHGTDIGGALRYFTNMIKKRSISFLISDFMSDNYMDPLKIAARKHDLVAIRIFDQRETELPDIGLIRLQDAETGKLLWVDTSRRITRERYRLNWETRQKEMDNVFARRGVDQVKIATNQNYVQPLINLFKKREKRA
ncbi:MAG TPA: VWA domain-containing protein, partial [Bacteroidia bacterium]|nr:VWA domain-containing protein [Bacteroidia bacterium]